MSKKLTIGLFGFGVVGQGLHDIIRTKNLNIEIVKICIKDGSKQRSLPSHLFTTDKEELLNNPEINTIVELINDTEAAFEIVSRTLSTGRNVVSASKKMIATHLDDIKGTPNIDAPADGSGNLNFRWNDMVDGKGTICE